MLIDLLCSSMFAFLLVVWPDVVAALGHYCLLYVPIFPINLQTVLVTWMDSFLKSKLTLTRTWISCTLLSFSVHLIVCTIFTVPCLHLFPRSETVNLSYGQIHSHIRYSEEKIWKEVPAGLIIIRPGEGWMQNKRHKEGWGGWRGAVGTGRRAEFP